MNSLKQHIDKRLNSIEVSPNLINNIQDSSKANKHYRKHNRFKKYVTIPLVTIMGMFLSTTALAATIPSVNSWLFGVNPSFADMLYPVNLSFEDNGIELDVIYAANDNHTSMVYFSLQDITSDRIDDTTDIYNYNLIGTNVATCRLVSYDENTNTAFFQMLGTGGSDMSGNMTLLSIQSFISDKTEYALYDTQLDIAGLVDKNVSSLPLDNFISLGGGCNKRGMDYDEQISVLALDEMDLSLGKNIDFVSISNIGIVDDKLHIQTKWDESVDNHGYLSLIDNNGDSLPCASYSFRIEDYTQGRDSYPEYIEYVFDIGCIDKLQSCSLWAEFVEEGKYTKGAWSVNFRLSNADSIDICSDLAESIEISTLGIYIDGYNSANTNCDVAIRLKDGTKKLIENCISSNGSNSSESINIIFDCPLNIEDIKNVTLDGKLIYDA